MSILHQFTFCKFTICLQIKAAHYCCQSSLKEEAKYWILTEVAEQPQCKQLKAWKIH